MYGVAVVALAAASGAMAQVTGTYPAVPLISKHFDSPADLPYKVDSDTGLVRGTQYGFNICNSTTENQQSNCQTFYYNDIDDFCITAPPEPGKLVADLEGEMVAWCSKPGHGTRLIPAGAITGIEQRRAKGYMQIVGFIDQTQINMSKDDYGGEMDSGGADGRGNPMGGVFFSTAFGGKLVNTPNWANFMGGGQFALKICDPADADRAHNCEHIYDRIGAAYNMPNAAKDGVFVSCDADNADFPGVYTSNGQVMTYTQPPESLGAITTMPYQPKVPASSNCKTYTSAQLFTGLPSGSASPSATGKSSSTSGKTSVKATGTPSSTGTGAGAQSTNSGAEALVISAAATIFGVLFAGLFLA